MWSLQNVPVTSYGYYQHLTMNIYAIHYKNVLFREYILHENSSTIIKNIQHFVISGDMFLGLPAG